MRTIEDISNLLNAGADKVSINTAAVTNDNLVKELTSLKKFTNCNFFLMFLLNLKDVNDVCFHRII